MQARISIIVIIGNGQWNQSNKHRLILFKRKTKGNLPPRFEHVCMRAFSMTGPFKIIEIMRQRLSRALHDRATYFGQLANNALLF